MKKGTLMGAIVGDTIGSAYEFNPTKDYDFDMYHKYSKYTDDSVMTIAIANAILTDKNLAPRIVISSMKYYGQEHPTVGYGGTFIRWLRTSNNEPYNSWGNGSAMRVSACGFAYDTLEETLDAAKKSAEVTHNHPEGIRGAQATAAAIFMARNGENKDGIKKYITYKFGYNLDYHCNDIRDSYQFEVSCQESVPQSIVAFIDSTDYESAIRLAISLGGDADTMGAITGAIALAFYKEMPDEMYDFAWDRLTDDLKATVTEFDNKYLK